MNIADLFDPDFRIFYNRSFVEHPRNVDESYLCMYFESSLSKYSHYSPYKGDISVNAHVPIDFPFDDSKISIILVDPSKMISYLSSLMSTYINIVQVYSSLGRSRWHSADRAIEQMLNNNFSCYLLTMSTDELIAYGCACCEYFKYDRRVEFINVLYYYYLILSILVSNDSPAGKLCVASFVARQSLDYYNPADAQDGFLASFWSLLKNTANFCTNILSTAIEYCCSIANELLTSSLNFMALTFDPSASMISSFLNTLKSMFNKLLGCCSTTVKFIEEKTEDLVDCFEALSSLITLKLKSTKLADCTYLSRTGLTLFFVVLGIWVACQIGFIGYAVLQKMLGLVTNFSNSFTKLEPQGPDAELSIPGTIISLLCVFICGWEYTDHPLIKNLGKLISRFAPMKASMDKALSIICALLPACISKFLFNLNPTTTDAILSDMSDFITDVNVARVFSTTPSAIISDDYVKIITELLTRGNSIVSRIKEVKSTDLKQSPIYTPFFQSLTSITTLTSNIVQIRRSSEGRPRPVWAHFIGDAGAGKTFFTQNASVLFSGLRRFDGQAVAYPKNFTIPTASAYWDGFQQDVYPITTFEEIWGVIDSPVRTDVDYPNTILQMMSSATFMPPMAAIQSGVCGMKGTTFNSTLFLSSHNNDFPNTWGGDAYALVRRMNFIFKVIAPDSANPYVENVKALNSSGDEVEVVKKYFCARKTEGYREDCFMVTTEYDGKSSTKKCPLTLDMYRKAWRFIPYVANVKNNQPSSTTCYLPVSPEESNSKTSQCLTLDQVVANIKLAVDFNVKSFLQSAQSSGLKYNLKLKESYDSLYRAIVHEKDPVAVFNNIVDNQVEVVKECVTPDQAALADIEVAVDEAFNEMVEQNTSDFVECASDAGDIYEPPADDDADPDNSNPGKSDPELTTHSSSEAQGPGVVEVGSSPEESLDDPLPVPDKSVKLSLNKFTERAKNTMRVVTNSIKGGKRFIEDSLVKRTIKSIVRTLPAYETDDPVLVEPNVKGTYLSGLELNAAFKYNYEELFNSLFTLVSTEHYSPKLANVHFYRFGQEYPELNHPFFSRKFNVSIFFQYLELIRPFVKLADHLPSDLRSHPLFVVSEDKKIFYLVDRALNLITGLSCLEVNPSNSYGVSNQSFTIVSPKNCVANNLTYWNIHGHEVDEFDPIANVSGLVSNGQTARTRASYCPFVIRHCDDPFGASDYIDGWHLCVYCYRVYHSSVYPCLEGSRCCSIQSSGCHSFIPLNSISSANLTSLHLTVPASDYSYFSGMAIITLALSKLVSNTSRVEHRSLLLSDEILEVLDCSPLTKNERGVLGEAVEVRQSTVFDSGNVDFMPAPPVLLDDCKPVVDIIDNEFVAEALRPKSHSVLSYLLVGASICGVVYGLYKVFCPSKAQNWEPQSEPPSRSTAAVRRNNPAKYSRLNDLSKNSTPVPVQSATAQSMVQMTTAEVTVQDVTVKGFMPMGNAFVTYSHTLSRLLSSLPSINRISVVVHLASGDRTYSLVNYVVQQDDVVIDLENDLLVWKLPRQVQSVPDRMSLLCTNDELASVVNNEVCFAGNGYHYGNCTDTPISYQVQLTDDQAYYEYYHRHSCTYPIQTSKGDCGTLIYCVSGPAMNKVVAMHVAGVRATRCGAGVWLSRETVIGLLTEAGVYNKRARSVTTVVEVVDSIESQGPNSIYARLSDLSGPNLLSISRTPADEQVNLPTKTCYKPTGFIAHHDYPFKQPAIMNCEDPRAEGRDPIHINLEEMCSIDVPEVDENLVAKCSSIQKKKLFDTIDFPIGARELTFDEAILGVPRYLSSIKLDSSAGYPLCLHATDKGKKSFVWFEGDTCYVDRTFKRQVLDVYNLLKSGDRSVFDKYPFYWLGFEKDELRKKKKISNCQTRMIFCNSLIYTVAFRMLFGSLLCAFNNNAGKSIFASGLNINSKDCHLYYEQLRRVENPQHLPNLIVGDYSGFDRHYHPTFQKYAYDAMWDLIVSKFECPPPRCAWDLFVEHELSTNVQIGDCRLTFGHSHFSGCFFTTPENCLVNELYFMYCFYRLYPNGDWSDIEFIALGDDHLVAVPVEKYPNFNMIKVYEVMKEIGQVYTDANKSVPTVPFYSYLDSTFLGSAPKFVSDSYVGALSLETLYGNLGYMTKNTDFAALLEAFLDLASIHSEDNYREYWKWVNENSSRVFGRRFNYDYVGRRMRQHDRSALSDETFVFCYAQGPTEMNNISPESTVPVVNKPTTETPSEASSLVKPSTITIGTDSLMKWFDFTWSSTNARDSVLVSKNIPGDALVSNILQVLPFAYHALWRGDVEVCFQVNGTPFMAGALIAYFNPLRSSTYRSAIENTLSGEHVILQANNSDSVLFPIPYRYFNDLMNTDKLFDSPATHSLGSLHVAVLSPLVSSSATSVTVTAWIRFPNSEFFNPKKPHVLAEAQGPAKKNSGLGIGDLLGMVPYGETLLNGLSTVSKVASGVNSLVNHKFIPLDDTPVLGGSLPYSNQFSSMSRAYGSYPASSFQLDPSIVYGKSRRYFDAADTKVSSLVARECRLTTASWTTAQTVGTALTAFPLSSTCQPSSNADDYLPMNLAIANCFQYMHCDFEIGITAFKTRFHSGRLRATINYGGTTSVNGNYVFSQVIDFSGEQTVHKVRVPWSFIREFMVTQQGSYSESLGVLTLEVLNPLVAASTSVATSVDLMITISLKNAKFAVPLAIPPYSVNRTQIAVAQGPEQDNVVTEEVPAEEIAQTPTNPEPVLETPVSQFGHVVDDLMELARRMRPVNLSNFTKDVNYKNNLSSVRYKLAPSILFGSDLFSAYTGGIRVRLLSKYCLFSFLPLWCADTQYDNHFAFPIAGDNSLSITVPNDNLFSVPYEMGYPMPDGNYYFDCVIPYQLPFNFIACNDTVSSVVPDVIGSLYAFSQASSAQGFMFVSAADDGLFGFYNPPTRFYRTKNSTSSGVLLGSVYYSGSN